jgi:hypothetical protein
MSLSAATLGRPRSVNALRSFLHDRVLVALALLLGVGLLLRIWFLLVWSPGITGFSDSGVYFQGAVVSLWSAPGRTAGYSMFLRVLRGGALLPRRTPLRWAPRSGPRACGDHRARRR